MSRRAVKWKQLERYLRRHNYRIKSKGGEVIVLPPDDSGAHSAQYASATHHAIVQEPKFWMPI